jgi:hypothetical protein
MSSPASDTVPVRGRTRPLIVRSRLDLPAPFAPSTAVMPPAGTLRPTPASAVTAP